MALTTINVNKQFPVGSIIQTVSSTKLDAYSNNATSLTDIPGTDQDGEGSIWCAKITPSSASNKILVLEETIERLEKTLEKFESKLDNKVDK